MNTQKVVEVFWRKNLEKVILCVVQLVEIGIDVCQFLMSFIIKNRVVDSFFFPLLKG